jgi:dynein heavy chain
MRMLFEVMDLAVASPATVSRCGMVYLTPDNLGWLPFVQTWMETKFPDEEVLSNELKVYIIETFLATVDLAIEKIRSNFNELIKTDNLQLVKSMCNFLEVFLNPERGFNAVDAK